MAERRILLVDQAGFCTGVQRALRLARRAADTGGRVFTYGELVHNRQVMDGLGQCGIGVIDEPGQVEPGSTVVIRAHGVTGAERRALAALPCTLIDGTCPYVGEIKRQIDRALESGKQVIIAGDARHPEVIGLVDGRHDRVFVVQPETFQGIDRLPAPGPALRLVAQSTMIPAAVARLHDRLADLGHRVELIDTVCRPTRERQAATAEAARRSDLMIVVGDRHSSNTRKLESICAASVRTLRISRPEEITAEGIGGAAIVGVTAGASTPPEAIETVVARLSELLGGAVVERL